MVNYLHHFAEHSNSAANSNNKADACDQQGTCTRICFHLSQHAKNESKSHKTVVICVSLWAQTDFSGMLKIIQIYEGYDGENKMQIQ